MKRIMLILISVVMLFTACEKSSPKPIDSTEEFNGVMFGMTKEEVINVLGRQPDDTHTYDTFTYRDSITYENEMYLGISNAEIEYNFADDGELYSIFFSFSLSESTQDEKPIDFDLVKQELLNRYPEETFTSVKEEDDSFSFVTDTRVVGLYYYDFLNDISVIIGDAVKGREELNQDTTT